MGAVVLTAKDAVPNEVPDVEDPKGLENIEVPPDAEEKNEAEVVVGVGLED